MHFISGLPRSGSTLLAAILRQNPRFTASMSSPVCGLVRKLLDGMSANNEFASFITDEQRRRILRGVFENYYGDDFTSRTVFDTNRAWSNCLPLLGDLFPGCRVIACVRDVPWILDSIERLVRRNCLAASGMFNFDSAGSVYTRAEAVARADGMLGYGYNALKEAFYGEQTDRLMLVRYETLVQDPRRVLSAVYDFIGETNFAHDLKNIRFDAEAFDRRMGTPGLHQIRPAIGWQPRRNLLPPNLIARFADDAFWNHPNANPNGVRVI
ncbi:conserved hypothetical protein [Gluconacetobacter diazotrophicus PA1 5]|nr:conserved hypothetical protein [Gluconacetobacter diazotrophicus PA1 5]MBB2157328.1 sulfotransferase [Gluconacetobacter diazotrophicus]TWB07919.1 sulfotransferase [Gluconacetobacter diazotrophicus]